MCWCIDQNQKIRVPGKQMAASNQGVKGRYKVDLYKTQTHNNFKRLAWGTEIKASAGFIQDVNIIIPQRRLNWIGSDWSEGAGWSLYLEIFYDGLKMFTHAWLTSLYKIIYTCRLTSCTRCTIKIFNKIIRMSPPYLSSLAIACFFICFLIGEQGCFFFVFFLLSRVYIH